MLKCVGDRRFDGLMAENLFSTPIEGMHSFIFVVDPIVLIHPDASLPRTIRWGRRGASTGVMILSGRHRCSAPSERRGRWRRIPLPIGSCERE